MFFPIPLICWKWGFIFDVLLLNGMNTPFVNNIKRLIAFSRTMTWRLHIERTAAKTQGTCERTAFLFKRV
jgi:hypothetical protein